MYMYTKYSFFQFEQFILHLFIHLIYLFILLKYIILDQ